MNVLEQRHRRRPILDRRVEVVPGGEPAAVGRMLLEPADQPAGARRGQRRRRQSGPPRLGVGREGRAGKRRRAPPRRCRCSRPGSAAAEDRTARKMPPSAADGASRSLICCSAAGSSIVVRSPGSRPSQTAWIARRSSLPQRVFGSSATKCTRAGRATAPSWSSTVFMISPSSFSARRRRRPAPRVLGDHEGHRHLALQRVGDADHRDLGDVRMAGDALLDLARAQAVAGDVDDVVGAAEDEEVAVVVADAPVEGAVDHAGPGMLFQ